MGIRGFQLCTLVVLCISTVRQLRFRHARTSKSKRGKQRNILLRADPRLVAHSPRSLILLSQLRSFITQLRQIGPPPQSPPFICNFLGGPIMDHRLCVDHPYGPYRDEEQMNLQIRQGLTVDRFAEIGKFPKEVTELIRRSHDLRHPIVFTHNDIAMRNIMIDGDRVTGLIDWECAGWLPAHWEYVKANWTEFYVEEWVRDLRIFIPPFDMENEADRAIGWSRSWMASLDIPFDPSWDLSWEARPHSSNL
ncbi:hypothetical protein F5890DRAFT_1149418 [Lentinula detonsa]|uniref:Aminoglycoside phosphotransferase domain-containing protein n=1 Tax=Lentinula detonsa TaxID=2804962 RepID=A0AA38UUE7_9AGAR|nr:hypothetical protein F5890DRAFT_1149418 [Lentinula detonsa]